MDNHDYKLGEFTFGDLCKLLNKGKRIIINTHYGNKKTYYVNDKGNPVYKFNDCSESIIYGFDIYSSVKLDIRWGIEII